MFVNYHRYTPHLGQKFIDEMADNYPSWSRLRAMFYGIASLLVCNLLNTIAQLWDIFWKFSDPRMEYLHSIWTSALALAASLALTGVAFLRLRSRWAEFLLASAAIGFNIATLGLLINPIIPYPIKPLEICAPLIFSNIFLVFGAVINIFGSEQSDNQGPQE